jgi:FkbM family methyltransferase
MMPKPMHWMGRVLRGLGEELIRRGGIKGTWLDVGAHHGEITLPQARGNPNLLVYAFEPNLRAAAKMIGRASNFVVIPMAVAETDGCANFHINQSDFSSSLLPINEEGSRSWVGVEHVKVEAVVSVPTIRLDTFMNSLDIKTVDFLKIDAQGMDLKVLRSAGARLRDIEKIVLEVEVAPNHFYTGAPSKDEVLKFLGESGFSLVGVEKQTHDQEENLTFVRANV